MGVLVGVDMCDANTRLLQSHNLRGGFTLDMLSFDPAQGQVANKRSQRRAKMRRSISAAYRANQTWNGSRIGNWRSIDQHDMAADAKRRMLLRQSNRLGEARSRCHQGRGTERALVVQIDDCTVNSTSESEVVCVDNQAAHSMSLPSGLFGL